MEQNFTHLVKWNHVLTVVIQVVTLQMSVVKILLHAKLVI